MSKLLKLYLDLGHGGIDSGAKGNGLLEKDLTLKIGLKIRELLKDYNVNLRLSRTTDKYLTLKQRTDDSNKWGADYLISVHVNAGGGTGYEDFIFNGKLNSNTVKFRNDVHGEIIKSLGNVRNRGKKKANFHMLREANASCMLTENMFIDNKNDASLLKQQTFINKIAQGHVKGIVKALKLTKKKTSNPTSSGLFYRVVAGSYKDKKNAENQKKRLEKLGVTDVFLTTYKK